MKKIVTAVILMFCSALFAQIRLGILNGPSCIPAAYLIENIVSIEGQDLEYEFIANANSLSTKLLNNEIDIGFLPPNMAAIIYNNQKDSIICTAITGNGNLSIISKDSSVKSLEDLKGKTVYVAGAGATPEYLFRYVLAKNNIPVDVKDGVTLDFSIQTQQLAAMLITGKIDYALVPEPFATVALMKDSSVKKIIDLQNEYEAIEGNGQIYPLTVMVANRKFAEENTLAMNKFLQMYKESFEWTLEHGLDAGNLCQSIGLGLQASVVSNSIPYANYDFIPARDGKKQLEKLLKIFLDSDPKSIGNKLPDKNFYY